MTMGCFVGGFGVATAAFPNVTALSGGLHEPEGSAAALELLPPMVRRRASALTRSMADAFGQAMTQAGANPAEVATVFGSAWGETGALRELLQQIAAGEAELSPIRFAGSVHNTASGQLSIATANRGFTTSLAAGDDTVAMALQEALGLLANGLAEVLVVLGDVDPPAELAGPLERCDSLAVALHLHTGQPNRPRLARIEDLHRVTTPWPTEAFPAGLQASPVFGGLVLVQAIHAGRTGAVSLGPARGSDWAIRVHAAVTA